MPPSRPLLLLLDWDSTLTLSSTLPLILSLPFSSSPSPHPSPHHLTTSYTTDLLSHEKTYTPPASQRRTLTQELQYLDSLAGVEGASVVRVESAGVFGDVSKEIVERAAGDAVRCGKVVLRRGWEGLVGGVQRRGNEGRVGVVSVGWSRGFISAALGAGVRMGGAEGVGGEEVRVEDIDIRANEIRFDGSGCLDRYFGSESGGMGRGIWTSGDKVRVMEEMVGDFWGTEGDGEGFDGEPWTVYVGDSSTDLGCLVRADVGICIRDGERRGSGEQGALREVLERVGVGCVHVGEFKRLDTGSGERGSVNEIGDGMGKQLWWARDFDEVCESGILDGMS